MPTPFESAQLNLKLFDLRREPDFCGHMEAVVLSAPDAEGILARRRAAVVAAIQARRTAPE